MVLPPHNSLTGDGVVVTCMQTCTHKPIVDTRHGRVVQTCGMGRGATSSSSIGHNYVGIYGLYSYGRYSYGLYIVMVYIVMGYIVMALHLEQLDRASLYR